MNRRRFLVSSSAAAAALASGGVPAWAQAPAAPAPPPVTTFTELRRGVGYFSGSGGAIGYLVNGDGAMAVDSQFMNTAEICVAGLKQRAPKGIALLVNTHHHGDHTGGNAAFKPEVKRIIAHANCAAWQRKVAEQAGTTAQQAFATATFNDTWAEPFGDETVEARYYGPGHTSGDAVITFQKANVVHMGDLMFNRAHPNIDRAAGAEIGNWITVLEKVAAAAANDTVFIAGHAKDGAVKTRKADVLHFRNYLSAALGHAAKGAKAGRSKEEVQSLAVMKGFEDHAQLNQRLTLGFVLGLAYDEATGQK